MFYCMRSIHTKNTEAECQSSLSQVASVPWATVIGYCIKEKACQVDVQIKPRDKENRQKYLLLMKKREKLIFILFHIKLNFLFVE